MTHPVDFPQEFPRWELEHVGWRTQAGNIVTPVGHREADARLYGWEPVYRRIASVTTGEPEQMRAEFEAWVQDCGCDTDGAWSAWQAAWNRRPLGSWGTSTVSTPEYQQEQREKNQRARDLVDGLARKG